MTSNSDYISVLNMDHDLITTVSQEFILQFYTIMNKQPGSLHRFYKEESTLIRDDMYAQGQNDIHKFYMNLELSNCKAVVLSLDAVKSNIKSILIQVTGEIANNGSDLRRFMQSFVLVEQDLGNFYVLNDIFRYQDQTFKAEVLEETPVIEHDVKTETEKAVEINPWNDAKVCETLPVESPVQHAHSVSDEEERNEEFEQNKYSEDNDVADEQSIPEITPKNDDLTIKEKSWAARINPSKPTAPVAPQPQVSKPIQSKQINSNVENFEKRRPRYNVNPKPQNAMNYPDEHQLFVGNLPQNMTEEELKEFFSVGFGPVKDVRIQKSRSANDGKPLPNFGFLVFHSQEVVEDILKNKPIYYCSHRLNVEQKMGNSRGSHKPMRR